MAEHRSDRNQLFAALGYRPLNRAWAKLEIFLGLLSLGSGLWLGIWQMSRPELQIDWLLAAGGLALFVLGGYLALAGHRSHLYRSSNELTALLLAEIRRSQS